MNTTENNKLIASFLGQTSTIYEFPQFGYINTRGDWNDTFSATELKFHKDWNWLMPVVEKIESIDFVFNIRQGHVSIVNNSGKKPFYTGGDIVKESKKEAIYETAVKFIKWYNQQQK